MDGNITFAGADTSVDCSGIVGSQPPHFGYGNYQLIASGSFLHWLAHQQGFALTTGTVPQAQTVGYVGSTGCSTGAHLHWTVTFEGAYIDPASLVP